MKIKILAGLAIAALLFLSSQLICAIEQSSSSRGVMAVYNYDSAFAAATSVYDVTTNKYTTLAAGCRITGYKGADYATNGGVLVAESKEWLNANGTLKMTEDNQGNFKKYDSHNKLTSAWTEINVNGVSKRTEAAIAYTNDGLLESISWGGWLDRNANGSIDTGELLDPKSNGESLSKESFLRDGRLDTVTSKIMSTYSDGTLQEDANTTKYNYDSAGSLVQTLTSDKDGNATQETNFSLGRVKSVYVYSVAGYANTKKLSQKYNYKGLTLESITSYKQDGTSIESTTIMDKFGREAKVLDSLGREKEVYEYNDSASAIGNILTTNEYKGITAPAGMSILVKAGALICSKTSIYVDDTEDGSYLSQQNINFYHDGNTKYKAFTTNIFDSEQND